MFTNSSIVIFLFHNKYLYINIYFFFYIFFYISLRFYIQDESVLSSPQGSIAERAIPFFDPASFSSWYSNSFYFLELVFYFRKVFAIYKSAELKREQVPQKDDKWGKD